MAVQATGTLDTTPFVLRGLPEALEINDAVLLQDALRTTVLAQYTVLGKISASGKYVPLTNLAATDGSAVPAAIMLGPDVAAASLVAGDVTGVHILKGDALVDKAKMVFENSLTIDSVFGGASISNSTIRELLQRIGIVPNDVAYLEG